jgi:tight adherence protein B
MMIVALLGQDPAVEAVLLSALLFCLTAAAVWVGLNPLLERITTREREYDRILNSALMLHISPRAVTVLIGVGMVLLGLIGYLLLDGSVLATLLLAGAGLFLPGAIFRMLRRKRRLRLEEQLVSGVHTLASGVRAGLNLVQALEMVSRDAPRPLRQEFAHLVREYEYGVPLDEAMEHCVQRVGSNDYRLLFEALKTHRQRGGDLGETLDRIAESIREIQRLESKVRTETARGRATARWLGIMPLLLLGIVYLINPSGVLLLFTETVGKLILAAVVVLNLIGYLWIRKIMALDI